MQANPSPSSRPQVILALPAYNEAGCIGPLLEAARDTFSRLPHHQGRILVVDDGSQDNTASNVEAFSAPFPVELVRHKKNRGLGPAIRTALKEALKRCQTLDDVIVNMDADHTHPPDVIPAMLEKLEAGAQLVVASRYRKGSKQVGVPWKRRFMSDCARWLFHLRLRLPGVRDYTCGFRAYRADLIRRAFEVYGDALITRDGFACTDEILVKLALLEPRPRMEEVPFILRYDRKEGDSKLQLFKTISETLKMLLRPPRP